MILIERAGLYIGIPAVALLVTGLLSYQAGEKHKAAEWAAAITVEHQHELVAIASANAAEAKLSALTATADATADQLEQAREALLTKIPPIAACTDTADDVGSLRKLIEPR